MWCVCSHTSHAHTRTSYATVWVSWRRVDASTWKVPQLSYASSFVINPFCYLNQVNGCISSWQCKSLLVQTTEQSQPCLRTLYALCTMDSISNSFLLGLDYQPTDSRVHAWIHNMRIVCILAHGNSLRNAPTHLMLSVTAPCKFWIFQNVSTRARFIM